MKEALKQKLVRKKWRPCAFSTQQRLYLAGYKGESETLQRTLKFWTPVRG
jgi:hypothetical protein